MLGKTPTELQRKQFKELIVERIVSRTLNGEDINGETFTKYSEAYAKKKGVDPESVDLFLEGDMLSSIDEIEGRQPNMVKIAVVGKNENLKAYNSNIGDTLPQRTFFGVNDDELESIVGAIKSSVNTRNRRQSIGDIIDQIELEQLWQN